MDHNITAKLDTSKLSQFNGKDAEDIIEKIADYKIKNGKFWRSIFVGCIISLLTIIGIFVYLYNTSPIGRFGDKVNGELYVFVIIISFVFMVVSFFGVVVNQYEISFSKESATKYLMEKIDI